MRVVILEYISLNVCRNMIVKQLFFFHLLPLLPVFLPFVLFRNEGLRRTCASKSLQTNHLFDFVTVSSESKLTSYAYMFHKQSHMVCGCDSYSSLVPFFKRNISPFLFTFAFPSSSPKLQCLTILPLDQTPFRTRTKTRSLMLKRSIGLGSDFDIFGRRMQSSTSSGANINPSSPFLPSS